MLTLMPTPHFNDTSGRDPVVALGHLFHQTGEAFELLFTDYQPELRQQLNAAGLYEYPWWNVFDEIQGLRHHTGIPALIQDLAVPAGATPLYRNQDVYYYAQGKLVMQARISLAGYLWQVERPLADGRRQVDQYDDRGNVSTRAIYRGADREELAYFDDYGRLVLTETPQGVTVSEAHRRRFGAASYPNIGAVVNEFLARRLLNLKPEDRLISGLTGATLFLRSTQPLLQRVVWLVSELEPLTPADLNRLPEGDTLVFPTAAAQSAFNAHYAEAHHGAVWPDAAQTVIAPVAAAPVTIAEPDVVPPSLYWRVGDLAVADCLPVALALVKRLAEQPDLELTVSLTQGRVGDLQAALMQAIAETFKVDLHSQEFGLVNQFVQAAGSGAQASPELIALQATSAWPRLAGASRLVARLTFVTVWAQRLTALQAAQLYLDTGSVPKQSLQLRAVSLGLPQLTLAANDLVRQDQNGTVCQLAAVGGAVARWLRPAQLAEAQAASTALAAEYGGGKLLAQWKELTQHG